MSARIRVADEVWLVVASLHQNYVEREDFSISEVMRQAELSNFCNARPLRSSLKTHVYLHCVANKPPNPGRYRMLFESKPGYRRLFRPTDIYHPDRKGGKDIPDRLELPAHLHSFLDWYKEDFLPKSPGPAWHPLMSLRGLGKEIWSDVDADEYVASLRTGWK